MNPYIQVIIMLGWFLAGLALGRYVNHIDKASKKDDKEKK